MRMLWVSFLLFGSIACYPLQQGGGGGQPWWWYVSSGSEPSKQSNEYPAGPFSSSGGYSSYPGPYYSGPNIAGGDHGFSYGVPQQSSPQDSQHGAPGISSPSQSTEESWSSSTDTSGEDEPVFTPVEDQDEVYALKSRSRYNRKRLSFSQFRYTPTEQRFSREPMFYQSKGL